MKFMEQESFRWVLPDLNSALSWCKDRNNQGICCTLDVLGEDINTESEIEYSVESILNCARTLDNQNLDAAIAIKLTGLGALTDKKLAKRNISKLFNETSELRTNLELDMEGKPLVEFTIEIAFALVESGFPVTLALQAYLDRTPQDIKNAIDKDITIRLVKGAYMGDTDDFEKIQEMFKNCFNLLFDGNHFFSVSTHDPELLRWVKEKADGQKDIFEFGFLKGLADETKLELVKDGWQVSEYVPFGLDSTAYVMRRKRYLKTLAAVGRTPLG
jgi:proline dehydrogenase